MKHAGIFDGEEYDAREPMGFECVDKLSIPEENTEFSGDILPSDGAEVYLRTDLALAPIRAYIWKNIEGAKENEFGKVIIAREFASGKEITVSPGETLVVDFGQNCAGIPSFVFKAAEGTVLTCLPAELLNDGTAPRFVGWTVRKEAAIAKTCASPTPVSVWITPLLAEITMWPIILTAPSSVTAMSP